MTTSTTNTTYILTMKDGNLKKITVPSKWRVTFGAMFPGSKGAPPGGGIALRLYDGTMQKACFNDVESFRDTSIEILEQREERKQEAFVRQGDESGEAIHAEVRVKKWVNPDEVTNTEQKPRPGQLIKRALGDD